MIGPSPAAKKAHNARMRNLFEEGGEALLRKIAKEEANVLWKKTGPTFIHKTEEGMAESFFKGFLRDAQA